MAYKKTNWQDTLRDAQGNVIQKGTPLNAQALGKIEDGIVAAEQKIDNEISQVTTQLAQNEQLIKKVNGQLDFVEFIKERSKPYTKMSILRRAENSYQVQLSNDTKGVIYDFAKDTNDDYIKLYAAFSGLDANADSFVSKDVASMGDTTGTFTISGSNLYTTTVNDSFTLSAKGEKLILTINTESRGGVWSISVDGGSPIIVSCYNATTAEKNVVIAEGLANVVHTVVGTFLGDDPANPPSSSPSRGYLRIIDTTEKGTLTGYAKSPKNTVENTILATASNKEFAFTAKKDSYLNWIPEHDAVGSVFNISSPKFYIDGQLVEVANLTIGSSYALPINTTFELRQHVKGHIIGFGEVMELTTSHKVNKDGILEFNGVMKGLAEFTTTGYPMMLPAQNEFMNEFVTGILNTKTNSGSENYSYFTEEKDAVNSGAIISSTKKNLIAGGTLKYPVKTYRLGKSGKPASGEDLFLWNRASKPKMYFQSMKDVAIKVGDIYTWGFSLIVADIENVYDIVKD